MTTPLLGKSARSNSSKKMFFFPISFFVVLLDEKATGVQVHNYSVFSCDEIGAAYALAAVSAGNGAAHFH